MVSAPAAADCYHYCLSDPAVHVVLTAPRSVAELNGNLEILDFRPMGSRERGRWERFGDLVYGVGKDAFETQWP